MKAGENNPQNLKTGFCAYGVAGTATLRRQGFGLLMLAIGCNALQLPKFCVRGFDQVASEIPFFGFSGFAPSPTDAGAGRFYPVSLTPNPSSLTYGR